VHLGFAVALDCFFLVQPLQDAIVTLVQEPAVVNRNPHPIHLFQGEPKSFDRSLEDRRKRIVENITFILENPAGRACFFDSKFRERDISPPGKPVFLVPGALTVAEQNERLHAESGYHVIG
jgi:hypothetical protein